MRQTSELAAVSPRRPGRRPRIGGGAGAVYLTKPIVPEALLGVLVDLLAVGLAESNTVVRRWPRKQSGAWDRGDVRPGKPRCRSELRRSSAELPQWDRLAITRTLSLRFAIGLTLVARRVWTRRAE